jgi:hypothetical protein
MHIQLVHGGGTMRLHRFHTELEPLRDILVAQILGQELDNLTLGARRGEDPSCSP